MWCPNSVHPIPPSAKHLSKKRISNWPAGIEGHRRPATNITASAPSLLSECCVGKLGLNATDESSMAPTSGVAMVRPSPVERTSGRAPSIGSRQESGRSFRIAVLATLAARARFCSRKRISKCLIKMNCPQPGC